MKKEQQAYKEILDLVEKYTDIIVFDHRDLKNKSDYHLFGLKLKEEYGLDIDPTNIYSLDYNRFGDYRGIGIWDEKLRRTISWLDDPKQAQPENELLLVISFPTGAYIFGNSSNNDYPIELFQQFFNELKTYNPKYSDTMNKSLYWSMENASKIFNEFPNILKKYQDINKIDSKKRAIKKLKEDLEKLQSN